MFVHLRAALTAARIIGRGPVLGDDLARWRELFGVFEHARATARTGEHAALATLRIPKRNELS